MIYGLALHRTSPENSSTFVRVLTLYGVHILYIVQLFSSYYLYLIVFSIKNKGSLIWGPARTCILVQTGVRLMYN